MAQQHADTRVTAGRTLIGRYVLALPRQGAGNEAAVTATSVPPLSGGTGCHASAAAHALTIADSADGDCAVIVLGAYKPRCAMIRPVAAALASAWWSRSVWSAYELANWAMACSNTSELPR